jgi:hypothetical protein
MNKYIKYKTKYLQLKQHYDSKFKILILDFDNTMTDKHSGGHPDISKSYWNNNNNFLLLKNKLNILKQNKWKLYIVSRGMYDELNQYINHYFPDLFEKVYGSLTLLELNPFLNILIKNDDNEIKKRNIENFTWSLIKVNNIYDIMISNKITDKNRIYFYDDLDKNIKIAKINGFKNSFIVNDSSTKLCTLLSSHDYN